MIITSSNGSSLANFENLLLKTTNFLNEDANIRENFYKEQKGTKLEKVIFKIINKIADNTEFKGKIELISGFKFPDIIVNSIYGVEIKSTISDSWNSVGNSVIESNRIPNIKNIFIIFGKLFHPIQFKCRPYEDCLSEIRVTHSPRYMVNMQLTPTDTIFSKMKISYEKFRHSEYPIEIVKKYYKANFSGKGFPWWMDQEHASPLNIRFINSIDKNERLQYILYGLVNYPEILGNNNAKFQDFIIYLLNEHSIICSNIRDQFTAGGTFDYKGIYKTYTKVPKIYKLIINNKSEFVSILLNSYKDLNITNLDDNSKIKNCIVNALIYSSAVCSFSKELLYDIFQL
ncbi:MAG: hypothetical protein LBF58_12640 [Deltaproteobacteria bacterium]|jgi:hypothetical protein|nr:hypothetical protein [Deltaproteobacteria bacterium]